MSTKRHDGSRIPEWYELPPITSTPIIPNFVIDEVLSELDCIGGAKTPNQTNIEVNKDTNQTNNGK
jgi:hypothetical protein